MTPLLRSLLADESCPIEVIRDALQDEGVKVASVWIVCGSSGSHSSTREWDVGGFLEKSAAEMYLLTLIGWWRGAGARIERRIVYPTTEMEEELRYSTNCGECYCPLDPKMDYSYDEISYGLYELPLKG